MTLFTDSGFSYMNDEKWLCTGLSSHDGEISSLPFPLFLNTGNADVFKATRFFGDFFFFVGFCFFVVVLTVKLSLMVDFL